MPTKCHHLACIGNYYRLSPFIGTHDLVFLGHDSIVLLRGDHLELQNIITLVLYWNIRPPSNGMICFSAETQCGNLELQNTVTFLYWWEINTAQQYGENFFVLGNICMFGTP